MNLLPVLSGVILLALLPATADHHKATGPEVLFDGKTLEGWNVNKGEGRFGELTHDVRRVKAAFLAHQALLLLAHLRKPALHTRAARNHQTNRFSPGILRNG